MAKRQPREALVEAMLEVFLSGTDAEHVRGLSFAMTDDAIDDVLGPPTHVAADQELGEGPHRRVLTSRQWQRDVVLEDVTFLEQIGRLTELVPPAGPTGLGVTLRGPDAATAEAREVFKRLKLELLERFRKGENKSTFRAPGLELRDDDHGWVAVFFYKPATIVMNAGIGD